MPVPTRPSFPSAPSEPNLRRLGIGGARSGGERPVRAQLVVASVVGLILLAVPLYLWRRPSGTEHSLGASGASASAQVGAAPVGSDSVDRRDEQPAVKLDAVQRVRCSASLSAKGQEGVLCDSLTFFEKALAESIRKNTGCAPKTGETGTLNYVMQIDFRRKWVNVFPGASGQWKGPQARRAAKCVERSLPRPEWQKITHQYSYYMIAIMASYPPPAPIPGPKGAPVFE